MKYLPELGFGVLFGFGLALSGMVKPEVVLSFLTFDDLGLALVLLSAIITAGLGLWIVPKLSSTALDGSVFKLRKQYVDKHLIFGAAIFGVGWGVSGVCPGAGIASLGVGNWPILFAWAGIFAGTWLFAWFTHRFENDQYG